MKQCGSFSMLAACVVTLVGAVGWQYWQRSRAEGAEERLWAEAVARLRTEPGIVVTDAVRRDDAFFVSGLRDPDFYVRATVIGALAERPTSNDLSAVLASYTQASRDSANDARLAAIQYVAALWKRDSASFTGAT